MLKFGTICSAIALIAVAVPAHAALITFEEPGLTAMANSPGAVVPGGSQLSNFFLATLGASFTSGAGYVAVVDHYPPDPNATPTPPNIIGGTAAGGTLSYSTPISVSFFDPSNTSVMATTNFVRVLGDQFGLGSGTVTLNAFDRFGMLLGTVTDTDNKPFGTGPVLSFSGPGIHSVTFFSDNATVGFDNFEFGALAAVPEPATWTMLIAGFGAVGYSLRRRRASLRFA